MNCKNCGAPKTNRQCSYCLSVSSDTEIIARYDEVDREPITFTKMDLKDVFGMKSNAATAHALKTQDPARYAALRANAKKAGLI